jgi:hypothetical protein
VEEIKTLPEVGDVLDCGDGSVAVVVGVCRERGEVLVYRDGELYVMTIVASVRVSNALPMPESKEVH